jgi:ADP-L-glycero-D-manno-heptose 6-epimerase
MRVLVTGATGFVGRHIVDRLVAEGHEVTITSSGTGPHHPGVKKIYYRGIEGIDLSAFYEKDAIIHQFANNDTRCMDEKEMFRANVYGAIKMFVTAAQGGCKKFIYASSTAVYGASPAPYVEDVTPVKPLNVYGLSKAKFDEFAMKFAEDYKVSVTGLRYCNVYGPGETHKGKRMSMVGQLLRQMLKFKRPVIFKDGEQKRDWIYVKDVVEMNVAALTHSDEPVGRIFNCGSGVATSFNEIISTINDLMHEKMGIVTRLEPEYIDCPFVDEYQAYTLCAMKKASESLAFSPRYDLRSGIDEYLRDLTSAAV